MAATGQVKRRHRPTLVCLNCRRRKTKCDRGKPSCGNCIKLGEKCIYSDCPEESVVKKLKFEYVDDFGLSSYINMTPSGLHLRTKRSSVWLDSIFSDDAMRERDPFLRITDGVASVLCFSAKKTGEGAEQNLILQLPNSLKRIPIYNKAQTTEDLLYYEIAKKFSTVRSAPLKDIYIPDEFEFWYRHYPYYVETIHPLIPLFDIPSLEKMLKDFFAGQKINPGLLNEKKHESAMLMLVYLIMNFYLLEFDSQNILIQNNIDLMKLKFLNAKWFQKTTLLHLRVWLVLRFHNWCSHNDNDGNRQNANNGLMGLIMGHCTSLGISWQLWTNLHEESCKSIWIEFLRWDRKAAILTGNDPMVARTMKIPELPNDYLIVKFLKCCADDPTHLDYRLALKTVDALNFENEHPVLKWEWKIICLMTKLCIYHGCLASNLDGISSTSSVIEELVTIWNEYLANPIKPVAYTSRIVELSMNKVLVVLPAIILRTSNPFKQSLLQLMNKILSTYFNEFPHFYHVFKRLLRYKLAFSLINREDSVEHMLTILKHENSSILKELGITNDDSEFDSGSLIKKWNMEHKITSEPVVFTVDIQTKDYPANLFSTSHKKVIETLEEKHSTSPKEPIDITGFLQNVFDSTNFDAFFDINGNEDILPQV